MESINEIDSSLNSLPIGTTYQFENGEIQLIGISRKATKPSSSWHLHDSWEDVDSQSLKTILGYYAAAEILEGFTV